MDALAVVRLFRLSLGLIALWALFYLALRAYWLDRLRQKLFAIRDDLFDFAADGGIDFAEPAYRQLRDDLNSLIRFADKVSFLRLVLARFVKLPDRVTQEMADWAQRVQQLPPLARRKLLGVRQKALAETMRYVIRRSLVLLILSWMLAAAALLLEAADRVSQRLPEFAEALEARARAEQLLTA